MRNLIRKWLDLDLLEMRVAKLEGRASFRVDISRVPQSTQNIDENPSASEEVEATSRKILFFNPHTGRH